VIRKAGTVQEYRRIWQPIGQPKTDGLREAWSAALTRLKALAEAA